METPESGDPLETRAVLLLFLVLAGKSLASTLHRRGIHFLPESAVYMAIGCFAAAGMRWGGHDAAVKMSSRFFYMALLPPIVFEVGFLD